MVRAPSIDKYGMKKGAWSEDEDNKLRAYIIRYGHWNWRLLPKFAGLARCGKSCRLRWMNYLKPNIKRGNYTKEEEHLILKLHNEHGNKWSVIAAKLPNRSDNDIKNYWHTNLKRRAKQNFTLPAIECGDQTESSRKEKEQKIISENLTSDVNEEQKLTIDDHIYSSLPILDSFEPSSSTDQSSSSESFYELNGDIWADSFFADITNPNEFICPLGDEFFSLPSPAIVQDFLWSYDLLSYE